MQLLLLLFLSSHSSNTHVQSARTHFDVQEGLKGVKKTSASGDANVKASSGTRTTFHSIWASVMKTIRMAAASPPGGPSSVRSELLALHAPDKVLVNVTAAQIEEMIDESIAAHSGKFKELDTAGRGKIPFSEIMKYIGSLNVGSVKSQLMELWAPDKVLVNMTAAQIERMIDESIAAHLGKFKELDKAGRGKIPLPEIMEYIGSLDLGLTNTTEVQKLTMGELKKLDDDEDGALNLDEFLHIMVLLTVHLPTEDDLEDLFQASDADGNGKVSPAEMTAFLQMLGAFESTQESDAAKEVEKKKKKLVTDIFTHYDGDKDGYLNHDEFLMFAHHFLS